MDWIRISMLLLFGLYEQSFMQDTKSFAISIMNGCEFQCANSTCLPFVTTTAPDIRQCQIDCLGQPQCKAITFQQATSKCQLFINIMDLNNNLQANIETTTMIVISETRMPPGKREKLPLLLKNQPLRQQLQPQQAQQQHQQHPAQRQHQQHPAQRQQLQPQQLQPQQHQAQHQQPRHQRLHQFVVRNKPNNNRFLCAEQQAIRSLSQNRRARSFESFYL
ncbi:hypothetical protein I4U23_016508 [Adineta vaga]|nr:hypothetical protein I4U23_016508 [Adineta vaga]